MAMMNPHALSVLEFHKVLENVAGRALSPLGRERVLALRPGAASPLIQRELKRVEELAVFLDRHRDWPLPEIPDARTGLRRLAKEGSVLEGVELFLLGRLLASGRQLEGALAETPEELAGLAFLREGLLRDRAPEKAIEATVDADGAVLDTASRELARIRARLRKAHARIVQALETLLKGLPERFRVPDASVTIRDGRYVIPVRREGKGEVGGLTLDESATGATLFVEPPVAQQLQNELRELAREEAREVLRILREQTEALRPLLPLLESSQEALVEFDGLYARARAAQAWGGRAPELLAPGARELEVVAGRHPLLVARREGEVVPFHLRMEPEERVLVVSGPNTGGKSVFLKALGLITLLAQAGVVPPVGKGTCLPVFRNVFADIGDGQSIAEDLSTFSAHLANLKEIVSEAGGDSLVLIDEMGTGTDPQEGAALSRAILEELGERGTLTVVTSHLGALKQLDLPGSGVVNASLQFDPDRIEPTYQLLKGRPGRSYGLAIARRLGFPPGLLDRAEAHLPREEARMEDLLAALERKEKEASELVRSLDRERERAEGLGRELEQREEDLRLRERTAETRAREEARQLLLEARREVEAAIQEVKAAGEGSLAGVEGREGEVELEAASRQARRRVEEAARRHRSRRTGGASPPPAREFRPGDRVSLVGSGAQGRVLEVREGRALLETAGVRLQLPVGDLILKRGAEEEEKERPTPPRDPVSTWQGPEADASPEVDLRGLRVTEVELDLDRALDRAVLAGLGEIRIIHGKGTGALRERVAELLSQDPRVREFRLGLPGEGGGGVTVAKLR